MLNAFLTGGLWVRGGASSPVGARLSPIPSRRELPGPVPSLHALLPPCPPHPGQAEHLLFGVPQCVVFMGMSVAALLLWRRWT